MTYETAYAAAWREMARREGHQKGVPGSPAMPKAMDVDGPLPDWGPALLQALHDYPGASAQEYGMATGVSAKTASARIRNLIERKYPISSKIFGGMKRYRIIG